MAKPIAQFIILHTLVCFASSANAESYGSGWYREVQTTYGYETNIARTYLSDEIKDSVWSVSIGGGYATKVGRSDQLILSSYFVHNQFNKTEALDRMGLALAMS